MSVVKKPDLTGKVTTESTYIVSAAHLSHCHTLELVRTQLYILSPYYPSLTYQHTHRVITESTLAITC
jgi:hypothetical protein